MTCATGATREAETSDPSRFSRESRANNEMRFTDVENAAWVKPHPWAKRLSWQTQGCRVK